MRAIHIHLHRRTADAEGQWKTINGAHVFIEGGKVTKGPEHLVGKSESEAQGKKLPSMTDGARRPRPAEVARLYHQTTPEAALSILKTGGLKPVREVSPEAAAEVYDEETSDGADFCYLGMNKAASTHAALGHGVLLRFDARSLIDRTWVNPKMEGGLAMVRGRVPLDALRDIEFTDPSISGTKEGRELMRLKLELYYRRKKEGKT